MASFKIKCNEKIGFSLSTKTYEDNKNCRNFYDLFLNSVKHNKRYLEKWSSDLHSTLDQAH